MSEEAEDIVGRLLSGVAEDLDVPHPVDATIHGLYQDVGAWMCEALDDAAWSIYPQGSARLGTMVRRHDAADYDIDSVVVKRVGKETLTQKELKSTVGDALDDYVKARVDAPAPKFTAVTEDRRCFTLDSHDPIHMDVLPAVPVESSATAVWIPDRELRLWQPSDPIGFANWFFGQMSKQVVEAKEAFAKRAQVAVEDVPDWQVRTPLQRTIQVLKAHRNLYFDASDPYQASSIVITATAASAYRGETSLFESVMSVATQMSAFIERDGDAYVVTNPAYTDENFADLWTAARAAKFFAWLDDLQRTLDEAVRNRAGLHVTAGLLGPKFGASSVTKAMDNYALEQKAARGAGRLAVTGSGLLGSTGIAVKEHTFHGA
jgi:hypothetical protein